MALSAVEIIDYVKKYADQAHGEQVRKYTGERYIVHPVRVMESARLYTNELSAHAAALLHDVLEDTPVTAEEMETSLLEVMSSKDAARTIELVIELTDIFVKESYPSLNRRTRKEKEAARLSRISADAQTIKYADIMDNVNDLVGQDTDFAKVYIRESKKMLKAMESGNRTLRERAIKLVDACLHSFQPQIP
ncbi:MAG: HD domain-containing protein [Cyclobacteriaceae bacterium]